MSQTHPKLELPHCQSRTHAQRERHIYTPSFFAATFNGGKSNASLFTTVPCVRGTVPVPGLHHSAPTHGCTFHPADSVTFSLSASLPVISLIWYLAFWPRSRSFPGVSSSATAAVPFFVDFFATDRFFCEDFLAGFKDEGIIDAGMADKTFSLSTSNEYGDGAAGRIASQMIASVSGTLDSFLSDEEYVA